MWRLVDLHDCYWISTTSMKMDHGCSGRTNGYLYYMFLFSLWAFRCYTWLSWQLAKQRVISSLPFQQVEAARIGFPFPFPIFSALKIIIKIKKWVFPLTSLLSYYPLRLSFENLCWLFDTPSDSIVSAAAHSYVRNFSCQASKGREPFTTGVSVIS